jgi:Predicted transcriptional regulators
MELCEQLKKYRKQNNLTQRDLALKLNVSDKTISSWKTGRTYPDISLLINLSSILKVSLDEFLKGDTGTVEKIDKDLRLKKIYKRWLISVITIFVAIGGGFIFCLNINMKMKQSIGLILYCRLKWVMLHCRLGKMLKTRIIPRYWLIQRKRNIRRL